MKICDRIFTIILILVAFGFYQSAAPTLHAQVAYKFSADEPVPGGSSSSDSDNGNDGLYIGIGLAAAALIGYVLYTKFKKSDDEDSSKTEQASIQNLMRTKKDSFANKVQEFKEKLPVDLYFGIKNQSATIPDRTYSVGIAFRF